MKKEILHDITKKNKYGIGFEEPGLSSYAHVTEESPNPNQFTKERLKKLVDDFLRHVKIRWVKPNAIFLNKDGSLTIIMNFSDIHQKTDFVKEYFSEKEASWKGDTKIHVEDSKNYIPNDDVFDLVRNKWVYGKNIDNMVKSPDRDIIKKNVVDINRKTNILNDEIRLSKSVNKLEEVKNELNELQEYIKSLKFSKFGTNESITYSCLEKSGLIERVTEINKNAENKLKELSESLFFEKEIKRQFPK